MNKLLRILGIVLIVAAVLSLLLAAFSRMGYYNLMDGSPEQYAALHQRMVVCFVLGIVLALLGAVCLFLRAKLR